MMDGRQRARVVAVLGCAAVAAAVALVITLGSGGGKRPVPHPAVTRAVAPAPPPRHAHRHHRARLPDEAPTHYRVRLLTLRLVDPSRTMTTPQGTIRREFLTVVRYPVTVGGRPRHRFPLIVFGHGFAVTPTPYTPLLDTWTRAGYVVAAPVFPLGNARAPGGPNERDLVNQPGDMSLVISRLTALSASGSGPLAGMIDPRAVAVSGQSDGGDSALAVAYDPAVRDRRVRAAMILSGAEDPFAPTFAMPRNGPPLLAVQGTADTINPPSLTYSFYDQASAPKVLLKLVGAGHLPPYTVPGPALSAVERTTLAFLGYFFRGHRPPLRRLLATDTAGRGSVLTGSVG